MRLTQGASVRVEGHEQALQKRAATLARKVHVHDADGQQEEAHVRQLFSVTNGGQKRARKLSGNFQATGQVVWTSAGHFGRVALATTM